MTVWIVLDRFGYVMRVFDDRNDGAAAKEYARLHGFTVEAHKVTYADWVDRVVR
jgi:hypothetical protein